jgi:protein-S-isoprenylcysteine O-methyltransferase Ste14
MIEEFIFRFGLLILFILFMGIRGYYGCKATSAGRKRTRKERWALQVKYESKVLVILRIVLVYAMIVFVLIWSLVPFILPPLTQLIVPTWVRWIGVVICIFMIFAIIWVGIHLGRQVSGTLEIKEGHTLVTSGPYKYIRHPMYLVYFCFNLGLFFVCTNLIALAIILLGLIVVASRIRVEEQMMLEQFGDEYREYIQCTGQLFPSFRRKKKKETTKEVKLE